MNSDLNFDDCWQRFKKGDKNAFEKIYRMHAKALMSYGYRVTSNRTLIEDSIHDLFVELWQSRERLKETTNIKFYLLRALRYKIGDNVNTREMVDLDDIETTIDYDISNSPENFLIGIEVQSQQMSHLKKSISQLPRRQQEAINLRFYNNFSNEEIAQIMRINYQSACKLIYAALRTLKLNLKVAASSFLTLFLFFF